MARSTTDHSVDSHTLVQQAHELINEYIEDARAGKKSDSAVYREAFMALQEQARHIDMGESRFDLGEALFQASNTLNDIILTFEMASKSGTSLDVALCEALNCKQSFDEWCERHWH